MKKKKILIIEDEDSLQNSLNEFLSIEGFEVRVAGDGEAGVFYAKKEEPDVIILDIILPKKDGFEVLAEIKNNEKTKDIPVVFLTNLEDMDGIEKAYSLGAKMYLVKSNYALEDIANKIKTVLRV